MNSFDTRVNKVMKIYPWYESVVKWYSFGMISKQEVKDGVNFLLKLEEKNE